MKLAEPLFSALFLMVAVVCAARADLPPGTILISRNLNEADNASVPGYWNHLAIAVSPTELVESQEGQGVIRTPLAEYLKRPYAPIQAMTPCHLQVGERAARIAAAFVGQPYSKLGSILRGPARRMSRGETVAANCVVPIKASYWQEDRRIRRVWFPDHMLRDFEGLFDKARPLADCLKPLAAPAVPPAEHSVLATPRTRHGYFGDRIVNLGCDCFLSKDYSKRLYLGDDTHAWGWKVHEWKESAW